MLYIKMGLYVPYTDCMKEYALDIWIESPAEYSSMLYIHFQGHWSI